MNWLEDRKGIDMNIVLHKFDMLLNLYPDKSFSEIYSRLIDKVIGVLPSEKIDNETLIKAIDFCLKIPEFLFCQKCFDGEFYFKINDLKIYENKLYSFRYVGKNKKRYVHKPIWDEYNSLDDIILKCRGDS